MPSFSDAELARYARQIVLREVGGAGQAKLRKASVAVIGCGGIGSPAIQYLAAAGIGRLRLIDDDAVDISNLQRQTLFTTSAIDRLKVEAARSRIAETNDGVLVESKAVRLDEANTRDLLADMDVIVDGSDNFTTRLVAADAALRSRTPLISAAVGQFEGQLAVFRGWEQGRPCYRCLVGNAPERDDGTCADDGVLGPVTGILGSMAALEAIRAIVPFGVDPAGTLLLIDMLALRFRTVRVPKDPGCSACGS